MIMPKWGPLGKDDYCFPNHAVAPRYVGPCTHTQPSVRWGMISAVCLGVWIGLTLAEWLR
jgi:hypothetical protein